MMTDPAAPVNGAIVTYLRLLRGPQPLPDGVVLATSPRLTGWGPPAVGDVPPIGASYTCISAVTAEPAWDSKRPVGWERLSRMNKASCRLILGFLVDDVGDGPRSKTTVDRLPMPGALVVMTSEGNHQHVFLFDEPLDATDAATVVRYERLVDGVIEHCASDPGAKGIGRKLRLPGSINPKTGFAARLVRAEDERWALTEFAEFFGVDLPEPVAPEPVAPEPVAVAGADHLYEWTLQREGATEPEPGKLLSPCPWAHEHTPGGNDDAALWRNGGWHCLHGHCSGRTRKDFWRWAVEQGFVEGEPDALADMLQQYAYLRKGQRVVDRTLLGFWAESDIHDFRAAHQHLYTIGAGGQRIPITRQWEQSADRKQYVSTLFEPGGPTEIVTADGRFLNSFRREKPTLPAGYVPPERFIAHVTFLCPDERERVYTFCWLATLIQYPERRMPMLLHLAPGVFGLGRSTLGATLARVLHPTYVGNVSFEEFTGERTAFDDWKHNKQLIIVDEVRQTSHRGEHFKDRKKAFEAIKRNVDTLPRRGVMLNRKYAKPVMDNEWFCALMFSNHAAPLSIEADDRRVSVVRGPDRPREPAYYATLAADLAGEADSGAIGWWLGQQDLTNFAHAQVLESAARSAMLEASQTLPERVMALVLECWSAATMTADLWRGLCLYVARVMTGMDREDFARLVWPACEMEFRGWPWAFPDSTGRCDQNKTLSITGQVSGLVVGMFPLGGDVPGFSLSERTVNARPRLIPHRPHPGATGAVRTDLQAAMSAEFYTRVAIALDRA